MSNVTDVYDNKDFINKREIQSSGTHTAKDVAALEVIVDMMKNPMKSDENNKNSPNIKNDKAQSNDKVSANTNSIQVHIAVPYEIENCKKRSLEAVKVRKVFTAKLSTPVDIEYQVHSLEDPPTTQKPLDDMGGLSPGVYLLVDNTYFPQGVALKPVIPNNISAMKVRQIKTTTEKMTSTIPTKNLAKVTLSKDFISAINKQLITLYNLTQIDKNKCDLANNSKRDRTKRSINWDVVNKIFGHDRVCNCKCKVNKTMCKACAASEAVMSELIFEFENLFKYMNEHCTEIQAYFLANPRGGKRLKDSVHKIDQSLRDYYKRVKGKCQGRTCITFATLIDERELHKDYKRSKDAGHNFINDLEAIAKDIEKATKTVTCFKENLEDEVKKLKHIINNCILLKSHDKTSDLNYRQSKDIKNVYSLDGVNVNIICNTESTIPYITSVSPHSHDKNVWVDTECKEKKSKGFKEFFSRFRSKKKDSALGEYLKQMNKTFDKREVKESKIELPLISDTGGSFWHDYIKRCSGEPKIARSKSKIETQTERQNKAFIDKKEFNMELLKRAE
ncbi:uncharacterized protein LOC119191354 [Manduca sexta]|uniref:uncharacterized protein LOC119191354 n=1 Tax=Manduca sexta TaxID=7130 RepID=UPI00188DCB8C|nr:uncharacterized protein LOC119191354 [Manduca sexta]